MLSLRRPVGPGNGWRRITTIWKAHSLRSLRRRFEAHLAGCEHCTEYLRQMRETIRLTGTLTDDYLTPEMRREFGDLFRRMREEQEGD